MIFSIDRLRELAAEGTIDLVTELHDSVIFANSPNEMEPAAHKLSERFKADAVDTRLSKSEVSTWREQD